MSTLSFPHFYMTMRLQSSHDIPPAGGHGATSERQAQVKELRAEEFRANPSGTAVSSLTALAREQMESSALKVALEGGLPQ